MSQLNKGSLNGTPSVAVNKNKNSVYHRTSRNADCQKIQVSVEYDHEVSLVTTAGGGVDCRKYENTVASVDSQAETDVGCVAISLKRKVDSQAMDHAGKPSGVNNDSQEDATMRKFARLKTFEFQETRFFKVNDNQICATQSESNFGGVSGAINNSGT
jgi:hypothetical protein